MTTTTNAKTLRQYKSSFSLIVKQILAFASDANLVREFVSKFQTNCMTMFYVIDNSH